jgi:hypothetical protein
MLVARFSQIHVTEGNSESWRKFASMAIWEYQTLEMLFQDAALQEVRGQQTKNRVLNSDSRQQQHHGSSR